MVFCNQSCVCVDRCFAAENHEVLVNGGVLPECYQALDLDDERVCEYISRTLKNISRTSMFGPFFFVIDSGSQPHENPCFRWNGCTADDRKMSTSRGRIACTHCFS